MHTAADQIRKVDVLEIGCGTGVLSFMVAPHARSLTAIDTSSGMIDVLKKKLGDHSDVRNIHPVCALLEDPNDPILHVPGGGDKPPQFDLILCHLTLHHIPLLPSFFKLLYALLKPGGQVALTDYEDFGPKAIYFHPEAKRSDVERHGLKKEEMETVMKEADFDEINIVTAFSTEKQVEGGETMHFPFLLCLGKR